MENQTSALHEDVLLPAMALAIQHGAVAADQRNICALLQVNTSLRAAVQHLAVDLTAVSYDGDFRQLLESKQELSKFSQFAGWLAKHRRLVGTLSLQIRSPDHRSLLEPWTPDDAALGELLQQLIDLGLGAAGAAAEPHFRLRSLTTSVPVTAGLLAALPAATLTSLRLCAPDSSNIKSALGQLTGLQQLTVTLKFCVTRPSRAFEEQAKCLLGIASLTQLTQLQLTNVPVSSDMQQILPVQLKQLVLKYRYGGLTGATLEEVDDDMDTEFDAKVSLQHLTCLTPLSLDALRLVAGSSVPPNLQSLQLTAITQTGAVAGLSSLHQVTSMVLNSNGSEDVFSHEDLRLLVNLRQLRKLSLGLRTGDNILETAALWQHLPLCSLALSGITVPVAQLQQLMQHISSATTLTHLHIHIPRHCLVGILQAPEASLAICQHLTGLQGLQSLELAVAEPRSFVKEDTEHLSALVGLSSLKLCEWWCGPYVDASTLCLLASHLTGLRMLAVGE